jgi:hypothetical protein
MYFQCRLLANLQLDVGGQYFLPAEVENIVLELQIESNTSVAFILFDSYKNKRNRNLIGQNNPIYKQ